MIKLVVFDLDGTLYDYNKCNCIAEAKLLEVVSNRLGINDILVKEFLSEAKHLVKEQVGNVAASHNRLLYMQTICELQGVNPLVFALEFYDAYWNTMLKEMKLYPYVRPLFEVLHSRGIPIGIITDLTAHIQYRKLNQLQIASDIKYITTSEEAGAEKPSLEIFSKFLSKVPYAPEDILMIGDNMERDVEGALNAGMQALHFQTDMDFFEIVKELL